MHPIRYCSQRYVITLAPARRFPPFGRRLSFGGPRAERQTLLAPELLIIFGGPRTGVLEGEAYPFIAGEIFYRLAD